MQNMKSKNSIRYHKLNYNSVESSDSSDETNSVSMKHRAVAYRKRLSMPEQFNNRYFPENAAINPDCPIYGSLWSTCPTTNISRSKIISSTIDLPQDEDLWFSKERLIKDNLQEVMNKIDNLDDEIWGKIVIMEKNKRVAKAFLRAPVLTVNGSDEGFDGRRIGLGYFEEISQRRTLKVKKLIGNGIKLKIDLKGNILVQRATNSSVFYRTVLPDADSLASKSKLLDMDKPVKVFDMRNFKTAVMQQLKTYPDFKSLSEKCISALVFVEDAENILECPCWILIINIVALDFLRENLPQVLSPTSPTMHHPVTHVESYNMAIEEKPVFRMERLLGNLPRFSSRDIEQVDVPTPDYERQSEKRKYKTQKFGYQGSYSSMDIISHIGTSRILSDSAAPMRSSEFANFGRLRRRDGSSKLKGSFESKTDNSSYPENVQIPYRRKSEDGFFF